MRRLLESGRTCPSQPRQSCCGGTSTRPQSGHRRAGMYPGCAIADLDFGLNAPSWPTQLSRDGPSRVIRRSEKLRIEARLGGIVDLIAEPDLTAGTMSDA